VAGGHLYIWGGDCLEPLSNAKQTQEECLNQQGCPKILYNTPATFRSRLFTTWLHRAGNLNLCICENAASNAIIQEIYFCQHDHFVRWIGFSGWECVAFDLFPFASSILLPQWRLPAILI